MMSKTEIEPRSIPLSTMGILRKLRSFMRRTASPMVASGDSVSTAGCIQSLMGDSRSTSSPSTFVKRSRYHAKKRSRLTTLHLPEEDTGSSSRCRLILQLFDDLLYLCTQFRIVVAFAGELIIEARFEPIGENSQWLFEFSLLAPCAFLHSAKMFAQANYNSNPTVPAKHKRVNMWLKEWAWLNYEKIKKAFIT